ncbi:MAG TPA: sigma-70 family RNA polymerase sigma factor [Verrucomicrobiota bacterium]|jgi:RNA polymerase sigma-70 factor (ECF subfamily)|nr:sigma-70 family RNA polymerase sigma factor [Verrucomicrobiota bacterium]OQC67754.1 MAG: RNA polymerase sigma factor [Verrucomicrobia bacterium ADurb.Bin006]HOA60961.1 sigma-70 family RNA polymerase sigma factor [Verrucomicrobiota bacterium]HOF48591.1 sigma-70 family RNA polymerase sigma factor [Verrucomicrobiota bacterium]HOG86926.1 sigma-70 family RNA polymerase sigma factor [Verrucomicrobiota bacterium]
MSTDATSNDPSPTPPPTEGGIERGVFATTHWSVVVSARDQGSAQSAAALETLCRAYWYPLYAFVRRAGHSPADAEDLTQGFFERLLEKGYLTAAAREKGRFRTFLLTALQRFLANAWDRQHARKRGGFAPFVTVDQALAESRLAAGLSDPLQPDVLFDRQWAMTLLERTMAALEAEYGATGRASLFEHLRGCLAKEESRMSYAEIASRLKLTEAAVKMAVHRLRARYRALLRAEIARTVSAPEEIDEEIRHLFTAFGP